MYQFLTEYMEYIGRKGDISLNLGEAIMEKLEFKTVFSIPLPQSIAESSWVVRHESLFPKGTIPVTETVVVMWAISLFLIIFSIILTHKLKRVPTGMQAIFEVAIEFLNRFAKNQFGKYGSVLGHYIGTVFLFLLIANIIPIITPISIPWGNGGEGFKAPFEIKPPTRDINLTSSLAVITILLVLILGIHARGPWKWAKNLFHPVGFMVIFNLMDFVTRPLSLSLRLFGNILGGFVMMSLIEFVMPVLVPVPLSLYFDLFDGAIQAVVFCFLTTLYINEAVTIQPHLH
ncbi:MAG: F0F1 ATP synthase subunit A [Termitinemataceae bacterium]|nr:MAG: F0F1 ATP synthase subunit A [Termitinemataceae bacterium]